MKTLLLCALACAGFPRFAHATLGGKPSYGPTAAVAQAHALFTTHVTSQNKLTLHQFTGRNGIVFAVAWKGKSHPDMKQLLGDNYGAYLRTLEQARRTHHGHGPIAVEMNNLHVELGGHMNAVYGRIWQMNLLPPQVNPNDIQ